MRNVTFKPNKTIEPCPKCGNNTKFKMYSEQVAEDGCELWCHCGKCGFTPFEGLNKIEDVWGGLDDDNVKWIASVWSDEIKELQNDRP